MAVEIIYETHSTTVDNESGIATGWLPSRLSETGRCQACALGERHREDGIAAVFVSDLARAVETAHIAFGDTETAIIQDARLRECNYGEMNGMPVAQLAVARSRHIDRPFPGGQSYGDVVNEMKSFLQDLAMNFNGCTVLIISHSANKWALDHLLAGVSLAELVDAPFGWQEGWRYTLPDAWTG